MVTEEEVEVTKLRVEASGSWKGKNLEENNKISVLSMDKGNMEFCGV